jgi:type II secretory pathway component GspD/PulD (secretin)
VQPSANGSSGGGGGQAVALRRARCGSTTAPDLDTKQASTLVRVHDANTVVIGGLIQTQKAHNDTKIPFLGDIPFLGRLFTGTYRFNQKVELVIFVTPHIIREGFERPLPAVGTTHRSATPLKPESSRQRRKDAKTLKKEEGIKREMAEHLFNLSVSFPTRFVFASLGFAVKT